MIRTPTRKVRLRVSGFLALAFCLAPATHAACVGQQGGDLAELEERAFRDPARVLPRESSMVKLKTTEVARETALAGMQMMGGYGYATEYDMERYVRSALVTTIFGGTNEIQREIIGRTYGL